MSTFYKKLEDLQKKLLKLFPSKSKNLIRFKVDVRELHDGINNKRSNRSILNTVNSILKRSNKNQSDIVSILTMLEIKLGELQDNIKSARREINSIVSYYYKSNKQ